MENKIRHESGVYRIMPDSPKPSDIIYWCRTNKKLKFSLNELLTFFGESKIDLINKSLDSLKEKSVIREEEGKFVINGK